MAPPRNMAHIKASKKKKLSYMQKAIHSGFTTVYSAPIHITQNFYQSPPTPPSFYQQFFKHVPPPPPHQQLFKQPNTNQDLHFQNPSTTNIPSNNPSNNYPSNNDSSTTSTLTTHTPPPEFTDYSNWKPDNRKSKSIGVAPKLTVAFRPETKISRAPMTNVNIFKNKSKERMTIPSHLTKKVISTHVQPSPPPPKYDLEGECEFTVAINTSNTPVTTNAAKPLRRKKKTEQEQEPEEPEIKQRTIILSDDYNLELYSATSID